MAPTTRTFRSVPAGPPPARPPHSGPRPSEPGFTVAEILIALTILALLVTSMAVAFQASLKNCQENEKIAAVTQTARSLLSRMTRHVRSADAIDLAAPSGQLIAILPDDSSGDQHEVRYLLDSGAKQLRYEERVNGAVTESQVILGSNDGIEVLGFSKTIETGTDWQGLTCAKSVTMRLTIRQEGRSSTMSASASPRRNQSY